MATPNNTPSAAAITEHTTFDPTKAQRISHRAVPQQPPAIQDPDPSWAAAFSALESRIRAALGDRALYVAHVGSTSVPGLPAKPVIDVDVVVADPVDEAAYVSRLVGEGWEGTGTGMGATGDKGAGLQFILREPEWLQHRFFVSVDPVANVHVFGPGCPEVVRHRMFRDWLVELTICAHHPGGGHKQHPEDRDRYAAVKREAAAASREAGESVQDYTERKQFVIIEILDRAFRAQGLLQ